MGIKKYHKNPRTINEAQLDDLEIWLEELGDLSGVVHDLNSNEIIGGNQRSEVFNINDCEIELTHQQEPDAQGTVAHGFVVWRGNRYAYRAVRWTAEQCEKGNIIANKAGGVWDFEVLNDAFVRDDLLDWGFEAWELDENGVGDGGGEPPEEKDAEPQTSRAEELRQEWGVETGQLWRLPSRVPGHEHRLICGDCTDTAVVEKVMGGEVADLCHADPPYGMGKEKDGIANDNLYREKLDAFQMLWWAAARPFLADNASAYIWGNAEDLWRLWYCGGLRDFERMTLRNEIVWDKENGQGMLSDAHRMYPTGSERCLFFMLGEQGFNNNADMFWEGWRPILNWLREQKQVMGWSGHDVHRILGVGDKGGGLSSHYFGESQWTLPTREHYERLKAAANGEAFRRDYDALRRDYDALRRDYDALRRDFYATRAYFDNTHDNMTDVWDYPRVMGDDRHGHATPKPVAMMTRAVKSSCPSNGRVFVPFGGTAPELIASENTGRQCRLVELSADYCAVILQRYRDAFDIEPELIG